MELLLWGGIALVFVILLLVLIGWVGSKVHSDAAPTPILGVVEPPRVMHAWIVPLTEEEEEELRRDMEKNA